MTTGFAAKIRENLQTFCRGPQRKSLSAGFIGDGDVRLLGKISGMTPQQQQGVTNGRF